MKLKVILVGLMLCGSAFGENCRLVRGTSEEGRLIATFSCLTNENLRVSGTCHDSDTLMPYVTRKVASNRVICISPSYAFRANSQDQFSGFLCDDNDQVDTSCLPAMKLTYECCS